jgi:hypothetical protein
MNTIFCRNLTEVSGMERGPCSAIVNIEDQAHNFHWVGSGEASTWTLEALSDLCAFMTSFYTHPEFLSTLERKAKEGGSTVTDMSLIWLWWVARLRDETDGNKIGNMNTADLINYLVCMSRYSIYACIHVCIYG